MNTLYDCENAKLNPNYQKQYRAAKKMVAIKPQDATSLYKNAMVNYKMYDELQYCPFSCINDMEKCIKLTDDLSGKGFTDQNPGFASNRVHIIRAILYFRPPSFLF